MQDLAAKLLKKVVLFLTRYGVSAWLVGGTVRDLLLGRDLADIDLVVDAGREWPEELAGFLDAVIVDFSYPDMVRLVVKEGDFSSNLDIELLREKDIIEDLKNRDFTINAMALPLTAKGLDFESLVDPWGGRRDLDNKLVRAVRDDVFLRDPVRILRAYRLAQALGFSLEENTCRLIYKWGKEVDWRKVAGERIWNELARILDCDHAAVVLKDLEQEGILGSILGVAGHKLDIERLEVFEEVWADNELLRDFYKQAVADGKKNTYPVFKLGLLLGNIRNKDEIGRVCNVLRLARWERDLIFNVTGLTPDIFAAGEEELVFWRRFVYQYKNYAPHLLLAGFISRMAEEKIKDGIGEYIDYIVRFLEFYIIEGQKWFKLPRYIDGEQVMKIFNIKPSPLVGEVLQMAAQKEIKGEILSREQAEKWIKESFSDRYCQKNEKRE